MEQVVRKDNKKKSALGKWSGYSNNFNSWIPIEELEQLKSTYK